MMIDDSTWAPYRHDPSCPCNSRVHRAYGPTGAPLMVKLVELAELQTLERWYEGLPPDHPMCPVREWRRSPPMLVMDRYRGDLTGVAGAGTVRLVGEVAAAVARLHAAGRVHGDLKPANVLRGFGANEDAIALTDPAIGNERTPGYRAAGRSGGAPRAADDVFALAVLVDDVLLPEDVPPDARGPLRAWIDAARGEDPTRVERDAPAARLVEICRSDAAPRPRAARGTPVLVAAGLAGVAAWAWEISRVVSVGAGPAGALAAGGLFAAVGVVGALGLRQTTQRDGTRWVRIATGAAGWAARTPAGLAAGLVGVALTLGVGHTTLAGAIEQVRCTVGGTVEWSAGGRGWTAPCDTGGAVELWTLGTEVVTAAVGEDTFVCSRGGSGWECAPPVTPVHCKTSGEIKWMAGTEERTAACGAGSPAEVWALEPVEVQQTVASGETFPCTRDGSGWTCTPPKELFVLVLHSEDVFYERQIVEGFVDGLKVELAPRKIRWDVEKPEGFLDPRSEEGRPTWDKLAADARARFGASGVDYVVGVGTYASSAIIDHDLVRGLGAKGQIFLGVTDPVSAQLVSNMHGRHDATAIAGVRYGTGGHDYGAQIASLFPDDQPLVFVYDEHTRQDRYVSADLAERLDGSGKPRFTLRGAPRPVEGADLRKDPDEVYFAWYGLDNLLSKQGGMAILGDPAIKVIPSTLTPENCRSAGIIVSVDDREVGRLGAELVRDAEADPNRKLGEMDVLAPPFKTWIDPERAKEKGFRLLPSALDRERCFPE